MAKRKATKRKQPIRKKAAKKKTELNNAIKKANTKREPIWKGPQVDGVSQSMLNDFLACRERFRINYIIGLRAEDRFDKTIEYGNMWHKCEEGLASETDWIALLTAYCRKLIQKYPLQQQEIEKWYQVCKIQFPVYVDYWKKHPDVKNRTPVLTEEIFRVPYNLPSGRTVFLKGKWDSVDLVGKGSRARIWLQENKTKGDLDDTSIERRLTFDMQTMIYLIALQEYITRCCGIPFKAKDDIAGVRYNCIRRPLSGGKGSIKQKEGTKGSRCNLKSCKETPSRDCRKCGGTGRFNLKLPETSEEFYARLRDDYIVSEPEYWFMRWNNVEISQREIEDFKVQFLNPVLEQLCDWYEWIQLNPWNPWESHEVEECGSGKIVDVLHNTIHWRTPFGLYSSVAEGRGSDLDEYLLSGNRVGLKQIEPRNLFPELQTESKE